ncbi:hypothetical protein SMICM17S_06476 [Streptomyces microflavus]
MSATRYAYLGPEGTFTEVALRTLPEAATRELVPMVSVPAALDAVRNGEAAAALVPIENSVEGGITATLDALTSGEPLMIYREVLLSITFALLVRPGTKLSDIKTVTAHPAAQPQVRNWMAAHLRRPRGSRRRPTRTAPGWSRRGATTPRSPVSSPPPPTASNRWSRRSMTRRTPRPASSWWAARPGRPPRPGPTRRPS